MKFKTKTNRINNESSAMLALRMIETVNKSGIQDAIVCKAFSDLCEVNDRYQLAIEPGTSKQVSQSITNKYKERNILFYKTYDYLNGLLNSPELDQKAAATLLFEQVNKFGRSFGRYRLADQSLRYIRIIDNLKRPEFQEALRITSLTNILSQLDQVQLDYEELYTGRGNTNATKVAPSILRKELNDAIKLYMDEVNWMATRTATSEWLTLRTNLEQRFLEVNVTSTRKTTATTADTL